MFRLICVAWSGSIQSCIDIMPFNNIKLVSLNVNGLNNPVKRSKVLVKLKKEHAQVILLQETHLSSQEHEKLKNLVLQTYTTVHLSPIIEEV